MGEGGSREQIHPWDWIWDGKVVKGHIGRMWGWKWKTEIGRFPLAECSFLLEGRTPGYNTAGTEGSGCFHQRALIVSY